MAGRAKGVGWLAGWGIGGAGLVAVRVGWPGGLVGWAGRVGCGLAGWGGDRKLGEKLWWFLEKLP